jgi:hypothetical protein
MPATFPIERDDEFYVFLKSSLPAGLRIESTPSTSYYSEWLFHYDLYEGAVLKQTFEGDFRTLEKGRLVREAKAVLSNLDVGCQSC